MAERSFFCTKHDTYLVDETNLVGVWPQCPKCQAVRDKGLCVECEKHPAKVVFSTSVLDAIHGMTESICQCCYVARIEQTLKDVSENLVKAKELLARNPCAPNETGGKPL